MSAANYTGERATQGELTTLWVLSTVSSTLSYFGSLFLVYALLRYGLRTRMDALLVVLAGLGVISHAAFLCGRAFIPAAGERPGFMCLLQANGIQTFSIASIVWTGWLSVAELLSIQPGGVALSAPPTLLWILVPLLPILGFSCTTSVVIQSLEGYGDATLWCWIHSNLPRPSIEPSAEPSTDLPRPSIEPSANLRRPLISGAGSSRATRRGSWASTTCPSPSPGPPRSPPSSARAARSPAASATPTAPGSAGERAWTAPRRRLDCLRSCGASNV